MTGGEVARCGSAELWASHYVNVYVIEVYVKLAILAYFSFEHFIWPYEKASKAGVLKLLGTAKPF